MPTPVLSVGWGWGPPTPSPKPWGLLISGAASGGFMLELGPSTISLLRLSLYKLLGFLAKETSGVWSGELGREQFLVCWKRRLASRSFLKHIFKESLEDFDGSGCGCFNQTCSCRIIDWRCLEGSNTIAASPIAGGVTMDVWTCLFKHVGCRMKIYEESDGLMTYVGSTQFQSCLKKYELLKLWCKSPCPI